METKQFRSMVWRLAYELLKPADWKRLAEHWGFTKMQMSAIEQQWTGAEAEGEAFASVCVDRSIKMFG